MGSVLGTAATGAKAVADVFAAQARPEDATLAVQDLAKEYQLTDPDLSNDDAYAMALENITKQRRKKNPTITESGEQFTYLGF